MNAVSELEVKEQRIQNMMKRLGYQSLLLTRRDNFSWISCGHKAVVSYRTESSPIYLLITPEKKYAVGYFMDLPRTMDEELNGLGFEPVQLNTFGKTPFTAAIELTKGKVGADGYFPGVDFVASEVSKLYEPYTQQDMDRYRSACQESAGIIHDLAYWVKPGMTERQVLAETWKRYLEHGFEGDCMFIVSDERIKKYRHGVPSDKKIEKAVILAPAVMKYGMGLPISRVVWFEEPPADIRKRHLAASTIHAFVVAATKPGVKMSTLREIVHQKYDETGYGEDYYHHMHGGPCGYIMSNPDRCDDPNEVVGANTSFSWYITITGTKSEEVNMVDEISAKIITDIHNWPMLNIQVDGKVIEMPDLLVRS
jgi:Xaa-Pro dipeptidase